MNALILVDLQNDFMPGGALPVAEGDEVVPAANRLMSQFDLVVATQDWHPAGHGSFAASHDGRSVGEVIELNGLQQVLWPVHCVQDTPGAELHPGLSTDRIARLVRKGADPSIDSYSGFFDNARRRATGLEEYLKQQGVRELHVVGLATDYCVKFTALDATSLGFETHILEEACRGVDLTPGDVAAALREMREAGVIVHPRSG